MKTAFHGHNRYAGKMPAYQPSSVACCSRFWEVRDILVINDRIDFDFVSEISEPCSQDDSDFWFYRKFLANGFSWFLNFVLQIKHQSTPLITAVIHSRSRIVGAMEILRDLPYANFLKCFQKKSVVINLVFFTQIDALTTCIRFCYLLLRCCWSSCPSSGDLGFFFWQIIRSGSNDSKTIKMECSEFRKGLTEMWARFDCWYAEDARSLII